MKKLCILFLVIVHTSAKAQLGEAEQLLLNVEKLAQLKSILQNMYDGYKILHKGYTTIKDISQGNFSLHKSFLDALLQVSPAVKNYKRVADIINYQARIVAEYRKAWEGFRKNPSFEPKEIAYIGRVYSKLLSRSARSLEDLLTVLKAGNLRMNDAERITAIDHIYTEVEKNFSFLKSFTGSTGLLAVQRKKEREEINRLRKIYGLKH